MERADLIRIGVAASGAAPGTARLLRDRCGGWEAARDAAPRSKAPESLKRAFARAESRGEQVLDDCRRRDVRLWMRGHPDWPTALEELPDPPELLFLRGAPGRLRGPAVALVGTRAATAAAADWTARVAGELAEAGWAVISGLARGIDTAAHRGALAVEGDTIAVLGCGPDVPYPPENRPLQERIAAEGRLVSEFPPGTGPRPHFFPRRNRILAALASAVVVVECRLRSGARVTARHALDLGREVFVVPGWPDSPGAAGPLQMLRDGARPVRHAADLLEDLGELPADRRLAPAERIAADLAREGGTCAEEVARELGVSTREAREHLARLELLGIASPADPHG